MKEGNDFNMADRHAGENVLPQSHLPVAEQGDAPTFMKGAVCQGIERPVSEEPKIPGTPKFEEIKVSGIDLRRARHYPTDLHSCSAGP